MTKIRNTAPTHRGHQAIEIATILRDNIISGTLGADTALGQDQLATRFDVSRMPIREALRLLEAQGLVVFLPNKTAHVSSLSVPDLEEIFDMRIAAETLAIRFALPELTNSQIDQAANMQHQAEKAPISEYGTLNAAFHQTLYAPSNRPRLLEHIQFLNLAADRYLRVTVTNPENRTKSDHEHNILLQACHDRNENAAVACLTQHIGDARDALADLLGKTSP